MGLNLDITMVKGLQHFAVTFEIDLIWALDVTENGICSVNMCSSNVKCLTISYI